MWLAGIVPPSCPAQQGAYTHTRPRPHRRVRSTKRAAKQGGEPEQLPIKEAVQAYVQALQGLLQVRSASWLPRSAGRQPGRGLGLLEAGGACLLRRGRWSCWRPVCLRALG